MKEHKWDTEIIDGGSVGIGEFWICHACGASGGPTIFSQIMNTPPPSLDPFLAGPALKVSFDCDEAKQQIEQYKLNKETTNAST